MPTNPRAGGMSVTAAQSTRSILIGYAQKMSNPRAGDTSVTAPRAGGVSVTDPRTGGASVNGASVTNPRAGGVLVSWPRPTNTPIFTENVT